AYLESWWNAAGNPVLQGGAITANPPASSDTLSYSESEQKALFGEVTIGVTDKLDVTLGVRVTDDAGRQLRLAPTSGFRAPLPGGEPIGDLYGGVVNQVLVNPDFGKNTTNKLAIQYQLNDDVMFYGSWSEGFTESAIQLVNQPVALNGACPSVIVPTEFPLDREIITSREFGLRSDWLDRRLRFNATYFDAVWNGMRVFNLGIDPCNNTPAPNPYPTSQGVGTVDGIEVELTYAATDRLSLNLGL